MKKIIVSLALILSGMVHAQQMQQSNTYGYNRYSFNPAYAGASGCTEVMFSHLNQWVRIEGAPVTSMLSANTRIGKQLGVGGQIFIDKIGMLQQVSGLASASYGFTFAQEHNVRAGLSLGFNQYRVDPTNAVYFDPNDPIINGGVQAAGAVNTEFGVAYSWRKLDIGIASKQFIQAYSNFGYPGLNGYGMRRHMNIFGSYNIDINPTWTVRPSVFAKGTNNGYQFDFNADAIYKNFVTAGLGARTGVGLIARLGVSIQDFFFIGYAYETPMSNIASYSAGSHEIILGLKFCKKEKPKKEIVKTEPKDSIPQLEPRIDTVYITKVDTIVIEKVIEKIVEKTITQQQQQQKSIEENRDVLDKTVLFVFDKAVVQKASMGELESIINIMNTYPNLKVVLEGHTDAKGAELYNKELSKNRVNAVRDYLIMNGVDKKRIITTNYFGESKPIDSNETADGRRNNRRVDVKFIKP
jgi:type IX secretion system PorP/SprF family membrane protein